MVCLRPFSLKLTVASDFKMVVAPSSWILERGNMEHHPQTTHVQVKNLCGYKLFHFGLFIATIYLVCSDCPSQGLPVYLSWILLESDGGAVMSWDNRRQLVTFLGSPLPASVPSLRPWDRSAEQQRAPEACLHFPLHGAITITWCWWSWHCGRKALCKQGRAQGLILFHVTVVVGKCMQSAG